MAEIKDTVGLQISAKTSFLRAPLAYFHVSDAEID